jgi:hypothetical protein
LSADRATEVSNGRPTRFIRGRRNFDAGQIDDALRVSGLSADGRRPREVWFGEFSTASRARASCRCWRAVILRVRTKKNSGDVTVKLRGPAAEST